MKKQLKYTALALGVLLVCSCKDEDGLDVRDISVPDGFALSAGTSTNFSTASSAYDNYANWVTGSNLARFNSGDGLYDDIRTSGNGYGGGLGPVYAGYSCGSCHRNAGRTLPGLWAEGGSGPYGFSSMLIYVTRKNGAFFPTSLQITTTHNSSTVRMATHVMNVRQGVQNKVFKKSKRFLTGLRFRLFSAITSLTSLKNTFLGNLPTKLRSN